MTQAGAGGKPTPTDTLLGRMAVERKLVSAAQLREALGEQSRQLAAGAAVPRPLGTILIAKGWLTDLQLVSLLEEQKVRVLDLQSFQREDRRLGRILIHRGEIPAALLNQCLREQAEMVEKGATRVPRLGELLVEQGYATAEAVQKALAEQKKVILACDPCGKRYNAAEYDPAKIYHCPGCRGRLHRPDRVGDVRVDRTATGLKAIG